MGLVLLHGFLGRFEDSHCSAMVAFLLELGRTLGEGRKDFHRFEGELARSLCASHMVGVDVDWSACALKRSSEHASGRVASRLFLVQDGQPLQLDETWSRCAHLTDSAKYTRGDAVGLLLTWVYEGRMNLVNSFLDWASGGVLQAGRLEECFKGRLEWRSRTTWVAGEGFGEDVLQDGRLEKA